jgi:hypothetical protein
VLLLVTVMAAAGLLLVWQLQLAQDWAGWMPELQKMPAMMCQHAETMAVRQCVVQRYTLAALAGIACMLCSGTAHAKLVSLKRSKRELQALRTSNTSTRIMAALCLQGLSSAGALCRTA